MLRRWLMAGALAAGALTLPGIPGAVPTACAGEGEHRAVVVIDTGSEVERVCISFDGEISGRDALSLAGADPDIRQFAGLGSFVCRMRGVGPAPGSDCPGAGSYWAYSRAAAGTREMKASELGIDQTKVADGDVEGWRFGTGDPPEWADPAEVCAATTSEAEGRDQRTADGGSSGSPLALVGLAAVVALLTGAGLALRRRRA